MSSKRLPITRRTATQTTHYIAAYVAHNQLRKSYSQVCTDKQQCFVRIRHLRATTTILNDYSFYITLQFKLAFNIACLQYTCLWYVIQFTATVVVIINSVSNTFMTRYKRVSLFVMCLRFKMFTNNTKIQHWPSARSLLNSSNIIIIK